MQIVLKLVLTTSMVCNVYRKDLGDNPKYQAMFSVTAVVNES